MDGLKTPFLSRQPLKMTCTLGESYARSLAAARCLQGLLQDHRYAIFGCEKDSRQQIVYRLSLDNATGNMQVRHVAQPQSRSVSASVY